jgi:threonine dehydrogenase-like Zn-dependent dehydrogenase
VMKELDILGSRNALDEFPTVIEVIRQKRFPVHRLISKVVPIEEAGETLKAWSDRPQDFTKVQVEVKA